MASLYEIDNGILECLDFETGEIIDPERLENLQMERSQKIENVACWIKNLQADSLAYAAEMNAFAERKRKADAKVESLKKWLAMALDGQKFNTARCEVSFRRSERVEIVDEESIPKKFLVRKVTFQPDKNAIKEMLKTGKPVKGCQLVENNNTHIK